VPSDSPAAKHLDHILENINLIDGFVEGADQAAFLADRKTRHAVLYGLLVISEASRRLPEELKDRHPDIGWQAMAAAGNVYRHEYHGLDGATVWITVTDRLPALKRAVEAELAGPPSNPSNHEKL
jgi:uncharacterized protein with HEPN domain